MARVVPARYATTASATPAEQTTVQQPQQQAVPWSDYFAYRAARRKRSRVFTYVGAPLSFVGSVSYMMNYEFDFTETILTLEAPFGMGLLTLGAGVVGAALTPTICEGAYRLANRSLVARMDDRERDLYRRILKHRTVPKMNVSPGGFSTMRTDPRAANRDYYGESIVSVETYRTWLRNQRKARKANQARAPEGEQL
ncbi:TIM23 complex component [Sorochytrium milnesiophthora]